MRCKMHDWTLVDIQYVWEQRKCNIKLKNRESQVVFIQAENVSSLSVPHNEEWGPSVSINNIDGPLECDGVFLFSIEMQSGDVIQLKAGQITLPDDMS